CRDRHWSFVVTDTGLCRDRHWSFVVTDTGLCRDRHWCLLRQALAFVIGLSGGLGASACFLKSP
ncbi:hypothetical protein, partial [uncultured Bacteroides sp.]|uniref:hypothetical protein n=1 Tax=uncultured Bacteroides sp. TaxID=162156 RepID=UPI00259810B6